MRGGEKFVFLVGPALVLAPDSTPILFQDVSNQISYLFCIGIWCEMARIENMHFCGRCIALAPSSNTDLVAEPQRLEGFVPSGLAKSVPSVGARHFQASPEP